MLVIVGRPTLDNWKEKWTRSQNVESLEGQDGETNHVDELLKISSHLDRCVYRET